ncbi:MAG: HD domain-containing protein [Patescibacteria group bacterium]
MNHLRIDRIEQEAKTYFEGASGCHDWSHIERVRKLAFMIGEKENADLEIIEIAALLHDIGRKAEMDSKAKEKCGKKICHAREGAKESRKILSNYNIDAERIDNIAHCIETHRFRNEAVPETIEAKVLFDADKLDSIGAVGVARDFLFAGYFGTALYTGNEEKLLESGENFDYTKDDTAIMEYHKKLKYVKDKLQTHTGKKIGEERHDFMVSFFERFWKEVNGNK